MHQRVYFVASTSVPKMQPKIPTITFDDPDRDFNLRRASGIPEIKHVNPSAPPKQETIVDLDLKRTRYEIMKFATKSLKNAERISAEEKMIIELGGKREKNKSINYVELKVVDAHDYLWTFKIYLCD